MDAAIHDFLRQYKDRILRSWEARVTSEDREIELVGVTLRNDVPPYWTHSLTGWKAISRPSVRL